MKKKVTDIIKDVVENLKGYEERIKNVGDDYYYYDRSKWVQKFFVDGEIEREDTDDIYDTDIETICVLILQQYLFQQQIFEDEYSGDVINRYKRRDKMKLTENDMIINDKKVIQSFVWWCFGQLTDEEIQNYIHSFKEDMIHHFKNVKSTQLNVNSDDEDMNVHNKQKIEKEIEHQKDKVNKTLLQFTDKIGFSKNDWKKMLDL